MARERRHPILDRVQLGDPKAADELLPLVYEELRKLAAAKLVNGAAGHTLQPTALSNVLQLDRVPTWTEKGQLRNQENTLAKSALSPISGSLAMPR